MSCIYYSQVPSYSRFLIHHLRPNLPCLFGPSLIQHWPAVSEWVSHGRPNWHFFKQTFGSDSVSVADCDTQEFGDQSREEMMVAQVMDIWLHSSHRGTGLYIKDWHLRQLHPEYPFYDTPHVFRDDWMNDYYINIHAHSTLQDNHHHHDDHKPLTDDFRFVYMGKEGTFTPLHCDVYSSYSWSTNIVGRKRWTLFPPSATKYLYLGQEEENSLHFHNKERVYDIRTVDPLKFPLYARAEAQAIQILQEAQETIFVPSGWHHQVENITDCISINHNWANVSSLVNMYHAMCEEVLSVEEALSDVREMIREAWKTKSSPNAWQAEWIAVVQDVVIKNAGWGWFEFWNMVLRGVEGRKIPTLTSDVVASPMAWIVAPQELRPPESEEWSIIRHVLDLFTTQRQERLHIPGLADVLRRLENLIQMTR